MHLNPADVVVSHTILLPHGSKLVHTLRPHADTILRLTKRKRRTKKLDLINSSFAYEQINNNKASMAGIEHPSTPSGSSTSKRMSGRLSTSRLASYESNPGLTTVLAEVSGAVASHNAKLSLPKAPLPVELDANSTENDILLSAMRSFTSLTASHMEAIINTSIQIQYKAREAEKEKRRLLIKNDANSKMGVKPTLSRAYTTPSPAPEISTSPKSNTITKFNLEMNDAAAKAAHMLINSTSIPPSKAASRRVSKASEGLQQSIDAIVSDKNAMFPESTHNAIEITSKGDEDCAPFEKSNSLFSENVNIFEDLGFDIKVPNNLIRQSLPPQKIFTSNTLAFGNDDSATAKVSSLELRANSRRSSASAGETVDGVHLTSGIAKDQLVTGSPVRNMVATDAADVKVNLPESKFSAITDVSDEIQVAVESNDLNSSSPNSVAAYNAMKNEEDRTKSSDQSLGDNNIDLSKITSSEEDMSEISASEHYNRGNLADETRSISSSASSLPSLRMVTPISTVL